MLILFLYINLIFNLNIFLFYDLTKFYILIYFSFNLYIYKKLYLGPCPSYMLAPSLTTFQSHSDIIYSIEHKV
jgi:hypothetical protein